jgi:hypothetical protein
MSELETKLRCLQGYGRLLCCKANSRFVTDRLIGLLFDDLTTLFEILKLLAA